MGCKTEKQPIWVASCGKHREVVVSFESMKFLLTTNYIFNIVFVIGWIMYLRGNEKVKNEKISLD